MYKLVPTEAIWQLAQSQTYKLLRRNCGAEGRSFGGTFASCAMGSATSSMLECCCLRNGSAVVLDARWDIPGIGLKVDEVDEM